MMDFSRMKELTIGGVKLKELSVDGAKVWQAGRLPSGYTEVEYIETDGNSWIDTGVNAKDYPDGIRYMFKGNATSYRNSANYLFGAIANNCRSGNLSIDCSKLTNYPCRLIVGGAIQFRKGIRNHDYPKVGNDFIINVFANANKPDDSELSYTIGNTTYDSVFSSGSGVASTMPDANIYLFWINGTTAASQYCGKCYLFTMEAADGTPIRNYVSCIRNSDGAVGMFDLVTGGFFTNAGTGTMTAGGAV